MYPMARTTPCCCWRAVVERSTPAAAPPLHPAAAAPPSRRRAAPRRRAAQPPPQNPNPIPFVRRRHVVLPPEVAKLLPKNRLLSENGLAMEAMEFFARNVVGQGVVLSQSRL
nr:unnamed protein product [Digitaria exilis]